MRMNQAIAAAIAAEMRSDPSVVVLGEDVAAAGGVFKATEGLLAEFGAGRVIDTPISEMAFLGLGVGAAMHDLRPVVEIMFAEFLAVCLEQLLLEGSLMRYLSGGQYQVPLVVRTSAGAGQGFGAQHSQTPVSWFLGTPGLKTVSPSSPSSAYGLTRAAIRDPDPVLILEPRRLYSVREDFDPDQLGAFTIGSARRMRQGRDLTIVGAGATVPTCLRAADELGDDIAEVIDLMTLSPWDDTTVLESTAKTRRLVLVEEAPYSTGWSATVAATVVERLFSTLAAPPIRVTAPDVPVPFATEVEELYQPRTDEVVRQARSLLAGQGGDRPWWTSLST